MPLLGLLSTSVSLPKESPEHEQDRPPVETVWSWLVSRARGHSPVEESNLLQQPDRTAHLGSDQVILFILAGSWSFGPRREHLRAAQTCGGPAPSRRECGSASQSS